MRIVKIFNTSSSSSAPYSMAYCFLLLFFSILFNAIPFVVVLTPFEEVEGTNFRGCCSRDEIFDNNSTGKGAFCVYKSDRENDDNYYEDESNCEGVLAIVDRDINSSMISVSVDGKIEINSEDRSTKRENYDDEEQVCLDIEGSLDKLVLRSCKDIEYCNSNHCLRKCCPRNQIYVTEKNKPVCRRTDDTSFQTLAQWHMEFRNVQINLTNDERVENQSRKGYHDTFNRSDYGLLFGEAPDCPYGRWSVPIDDNEWHIDSEGIFHYDHGKTSVSYNHRNSCIEIVSNDNATKTFETFACFTTTDEESADASFRRHAKLTLMLISCAFLLATLLVYGYLTALQNLHGKTVMAYVGSLFFGYLGTAVLSINFIEEDQGEEMILLCKFLGYATLFFLLSVFAWLNVICYDIWDKFRSLRNSGDRREAKIRFIYHCIFAWGFGLILTSLAFLSDRYELLPVHLLPGFGSQRCWFVAVDSNREKSYSEILFFFGPVSVQLLFNVILYVLTARRCNLVKNEIANRVKADRSKNADRSRDFESDRTKLKLSAKLFVVMGISWIFEIVAYLTNFFNDRKLPEWAYWLLLITDAVNCLQGLLIFVLFVCKDQILTALRRKYFRSGSPSSSSFRTSTNLRRRTVNDPLTKSRSSRSITTLTTSNGAISSNSAVGDSSF